MKLYFLQLLNKQFLCGLIFGIAFSIITLPKEKKTAYVDVDLVITNIIQKLDGAKDMNGAVAKCKQHFEEFLYEYSEKHKVMIFSSPKPIAGAIDITDHFVKEMVDFSLQVMP